MRINEYRLIINDDSRIKELIYYGNENIIIKCNISCDESETNILFPRHILEAFIEMIKI